MDCRGLRRGREPPMSQHPSARPAPKGRRTLVDRVESGQRVSDVARQMGAGRQTAHRWLARARRGEPLSDRPCRPPRRLARLTPAATEARVVEAPSPACATGANAPASCRASARGRSRGSRRAAGGAGALRAACFHPQLHHQRTRREVIA